MQSQNALSSSVSFFRGMGAKVVPCSLLYAEWLPSQYGNFFERPQEHVHFDSPGFKMIFSGFFCLGTGTGLKDMCECSVRSESDTIRHL